MSISSPHTTPLHPQPLLEKRGNKVSPKAAVYRHVSAFAEQELGQERTTSPSGGNSRAEVVMRFDLRGCSKPGKEKGIEQNAPDSPSCVLTTELGSLVTFFCHTWVWCQPRACWWFPSWQHEVDTGMMAQTGPSTLSVNVPTLRPLPPLLQKSVTCLALDLFSVVHLKGQRERGVPGNQQELHLSEKGLPTPAAISFRGTQPAERELVEPTAQPLSPPVLRYPAGASIGSTELNAQGRAMWVGH